VGISSPASHAWQRTACLGEVGEEQTDVKNLFATFAFVDDCDASSLSPHGEDIFSQRPSLPQIPVHDTPTNRNMAAAEDEDEDRAHLSPSEVEEHFKRQLQAECNAPFNAVREWFQRLPGMPACLPSNQP